MNNNNEWVPVETGLPCEAGFYLVYCPAWENPFYIDEYDDDLGDFLDTGGEITHWCELPPEPIKKPKSFPKFYWIDEESEIYAGESLEQILNCIFDAEDIKRIKNEKAYGEIHSDTLKTYRPEPAAIVTKRIKDIKIKCDLPVQLFSTYG